MKLGPIDFPDSLLKAIRNDRLVVFAGAGVSMGKPANLPNFEKLAWDIGLEEPKKPIDRHLGRLKHKGVEVHQRAIERLSQSGLQPTPLHEDLLRLFSEPQNLRIVTTNFDQLFQASAQNLWGAQPTAFHAPALPFGGEFHGIVHLHGSISGPLNGIVLTDGDFGRAYLTEGWARRFLVDVFQKYTVLFIGYSHDDLILQYLVRALPEKETGLRYVLDREDSQQEWELLGVELITFPVPVSGDYSELYKGVCSLANLVRKGVLDWKREITDVAKQSPPVDPQTSDLILDALEDPVKTRFFVESARNIEWIDWLDNQQILNPLFEKNPLNEQNLLLAKWIAMQFVRQHPSSIFLLLGKYDLKLNPDFWYPLAQCVVSPSAPSLSISDFNCWINLLIQTSPSGFIYYLQALATKSAQMGSHFATLQIFARMIEDRLYIGEGLPYQEENGTEVRCRPEIKIPFSCPHWHLNEVWSHVLKPHLDILATPILSLMVSKLESRHRTFSQWGRANRNWCIESYSRSGIEIHEQFPDSIDVIIDAARDALEWISQNDQPLLISWCDHLIRSDPPLLRRLALFSIPKSTIWEADEKIEWLLKQSNLHDIMLRHEIFIFMRQVYPLASEGIRQKIIKNVFDYQFPNEADPLKEERRADILLNWLHWLSEVDPDCMIVSNALSDLQRQFPQWAPSEHPDLLHWNSGVQWFGPQSPWTVDQLLDRSPTDWLEDLLNFQGKAFLGPDRIGLSQAVGEAARQRFEWGQDLASALSSAGKWQSDLWDMLIQSWSHWPDDKDQANQIMTWLNQENLYTDHVRAISDTLYALVRGSGKEYAPDLLPVGNQIARRLWLHMDRSNDQSEDPADWFEKAINLPPGVLALFWLNSLSIWLKQQTITGSKKLNAEYRDALNELIKDESVVGGCARAVITSQLAFLYDLDENWATESLLLPFSDPDPVQFQQAWDGFLISGRLTPSIVSALKPAFFAALARLDTLSKLRNRFVEYYVTSLALFTDDPLEEWIPQFFEHATIDDRRIFSDYVGFLLRGLDLEQQQMWWNTWLSIYWKNRIDGLPARIDIEELGAMLNWLPLLTAVFPNAVDIAIRMSPMAIGPFPLSLMMSDLKDSPLVDQYPDEVVKVIMFLLDCPESSEYLFGLENLLERLSKHPINPELKKVLIEKLIFHGFDVAILGE